ncbi:putative glycosyltransferase protein [Pseudooceanicola batsensis HTCC2597]|uniref:Putative glycosyltransferase protein n=1 Tax=Pseudooceanicola batsensis (strain ATCC BAA-863 / DSM 15984 / KCTC 12145 / HTCC2597) TaxID=252305 RepID=A3U0G9_PSEBH|nr:glycosyltransferase family 4 protein [Pseudooceanicola batsensis]EAQ02260.1 putative glycosyltransferase protein [Pseudooceanicola batsensis HTCC2597]
MSLRILMTLDAVGGVWRYAVDLAAALAEEGCEIVFAGFGPEPDTTQRDEARGIGPLEWGAAPLDWLASGPGDLDGAPGWLMQVAERHGVDVLHLNQPTLAAGLRGRTPCVAVTHSCLATWFGTMEGGAVPGPLRWQVEMTRAGLANAHHAIAPSAAHAALVRRVYGLADVATVRNASRSPLLSPGDGDGHVTAAGRWWDRAKNGFVLDRAAALTDAPFVLIGSADGPDGQRFAPAHLPPPRALPHGETTERIGAASLFVSPSLYEPFGLAALEAARAGRPLLLADIPVYRELWEGAARFFDPQNPADLAQTVDALLDAPDDRLALGAAAQRRALRYGLAEQAGAMLEIYKEATARAPLDMVP